MFVQYPGLKSSCRSLWAGLPLPLAVTFGRRRAVHSFGSDRFVQPGRCTFAHSGSWRAEDFSKSASFEYPPFRNSHLPTRRVVLLSALYSPHTHIVNRFNQISSKKGFKSHSFEKNAKRLHFGLAFHTESVYTLPCT